VQELRLYLLNLEYNGRGQIAIMRQSNRSLRTALGLIFFAGVFMTAALQIAGQTPSPTPITPKGHDDPRSNASPQTSGLSVSGKVVMEDGTFPPAPVSVEVVCSGVAGVSGSTNPKGGFSLSRDSTAGAGLDNSGTILPQGVASEPVAHGSIAAGDCVLRIRLVGYRSETKSLLPERRPPPGTNVQLDVGTIILHPLAGVEATATSVVSMAAPKEAKAAFEKGMAAFEEHKPDKAAKELERAVQIYPKYAAAWCELGRVREQQGDFEGAVLAYSDSILMDPKFFKPYLPLTSLLVQVESWAHSAAISARAVRLDPVDFPWLWAANAAANFHLGKGAEAEEAARQAIKIDTWREYPEAEYILGVMLAKKGDLQAAVEHLRTYLELAPNGGDAPAARQQLTRIESLLASRAGAAGTPPK
jgi:tetratricopeptide (TPR) repeat protein